MNGHIRSFGLIFTFIIVSKKTSSYFLGLQKLGNMRAPAVKFVCPGYLEYWVTSEQQ